MDIKKELWNLQDMEYKAFHARLMPTINADTIIGVRVPVLRKLSKKIQNSEEFFSELPHEYYEENNLHAFLIEQISDFDLCMKETERFLPYIDNWATCDMLNPTVFWKNTERLIEKIKIWIKSEHTYTVRFGIGMLMRYFLDSEFKKEYLEWVAGIYSDEYYVNMMIAWYFATALSKQYDEAIKYIEESRLSVWINNKTIQKAVESRRISEEAKKYIKQYRRK